MKDNNSEIKIPDEKRFDFKYFFFSKVIKYWYLYVLSLIFALGLGYYYNWYTTPLYNATCTLLIKDDKRNLYNADLLAQVSSMDNTGGIDNEIELIQSRSMIAKTMRRLDFEISYFQVANIKKTELYKRSPIKMIYDSVSFKSYEKPFFLSVLDDLKYEITFQNKNQSEEITKTYRFGEQVTNNIGKFTIEKTENFRDVNYKNPDYGKRDFEIIIHNFDNLVDKYTKGLEIQYVSKKSTVLQLSYKDPVPQKAGDFLNMLLEVYIQSGIDHKNEIATNSLNFIDDQLELITADLKSSEQDLELFKTEKGITDIGTEAQAFLGSVKVYDEKISEIDIQISFLAYLEQYIVEDKQLDKISPASIGIADPLLTKLITQLSDLQNERKGQLNSTKPDNPIIVSLDIQIQNTKADLLENVRSIKDGLNASKRQAEIQLNRIQDKIKTVPKTQRQLVGMERQATIREGLYNYLLQKKAETAIMLASTISDNRVVDSARASYNPVKPVPNQTYTIAILLGLLLPALFVFLKDSLNDRIKDKIDLENSTSIPVLGMVGYSEVHSDMIVVEKPESFISESFRSIRTNIQYFTQQKGKCIKVLVTSSVSAEGKSFCAANLSVIYAISGKKVVLVNGDLRKPKRNEDMNLPSDIGISNFLIGNADMPSIIQHSPKVPNLDIILSGPKPPNPSELILNSRMDDFFNYLEKNYDVIIVDSPPIGIVTDGILLSKYVDSTIYIIRQNVTRKHNIEFINTLHREKKLPNLSVIFNAVKTGGLSGYGYGYGHGYGYGYGYGHGYYEEDNQKSKGRKSKTRK